MRKKTRLAAVPSTVIEFVSRLTVHELTPSTAETAFSTLAEHAAQLIPLTEYCSKQSRPFYFMSF